MKKNISFLFPDLYYIFVLIFFNIKIFLLEKFRLHLKKIIILFRLS